ncbi:MAG: MIP/aquaporin family protein [Actinomycetes bacterium]
MGKAERALNHQILAHGKVLMKKILAEFLGTMVLVSAVVGSGIMAQNLTRDVGLQLLINAFSTIAALWLLILLFSPVSGAHFNPVVTLSEIFFKRISWSQSLAYVGAQLLGGFGGTIMANVMFKHPAIFPSHHIRSGVGLFLGEILATAGLLFLIHMLGFQGKSHITPVAVALWIGSAYFFTSSTSFANPAVTFARAFSNTFSGISISSVPGFVLAQIVGATIGTIAALYFEKTSTGEING